MYYYGSIMADITLGMVTVSPPQPDISPAAGLQGRNSDAQPSSCSGQYQVSSSASTAGHNGRVGFNIARMYVCRAAVVIFLTGITHFLLQQPMAAANRADSSTEPTSNPISEYIATDQFIIFPLSLCSEVVPSDWQSELQVAKAQCRDHLEIPLSYWWSLRNCCRLYLQSTVQWFYYLLVIAITTRLIVTYWRVSCVSAYPELCEDLKDVSAHWYGLGIQLNFDTAKLAQIQANVNQQPNKVDYCFPRVLQAWKETKPETFTKETLVKALRAIDEKGLAGHIERKGE